MKKLFYLLVITFLLAGCALNLVTGRKQLNLVSESDWASAFIRVIF